MPNRTMTDESDPTQLDQTLASLEALHARHLAAHLADAADGFGGGLAPYHHVERVGVQQCLWAPRDRHMRFPEHEIAAPQVVERGRQRLLDSECGFLHVAVA